MSQAPQIPDKYLPESIQDLMTAISLKSVLILVKNRGGTHLRIPKKAQQGHFIADLIGMDEFKKLAYYYASILLEIPRCSKLIILARDIKIWHDKNAGLSHADLALKYQMTERNILNRTKRVKQIEDKAWFKAIEPELLAAFE